jgi:pyrroline-5-carboxylate reductase
VTTSLLLVGCGRMGSALLAGWQRSGCFDSVTVVEPHPPAGLQNCLAEAAALPTAFCPALVVFAVKPQQLSALLPAYARFVGSGTTFLSIAAGQPLSLFEKQLGAGAAVVRAMPNTPAALGQGISVAVANAAVTADGRALATTALEAGGKVEWIADESLLNAVTALSGSGPAYVFYLVEVLAKAGAELGLPADLSLRLARQTVIGSGYLLDQSPETPEALRHAVTSPGGTTEAALKVLMGGERGQQLFTEALTAARDRGRVLAG